ncbi:MAG: hypothetical protein MUC43_01485 [Pirellula sp.]|jgi:hypothetical protein|nr:hypothetical protein [Pirellula sp.]
MKKAIILSIDGLGTNLVGAYGNSLCPTPNMNTLASRSICLDQFWADSSDPHVVLASLWTGTHALNRDYDCFSEWTEWIKQGVLVTDDKNLVESTAANLFERVLLVEHQGTDEGTEFEELLEAALGAWVAESQMFSMLWIHSRGLRGPWDAPYSYRKIMCDEEDPEPPQDIVPISFAVHASTDPDEIFGVSCAVVGQVVVMDQAIGELLGTIRELSQENDTLVGLIGVSGYPLGEHGMVGGESPALYAESLHCPCLFRFGVDMPVGVRLPTIMQPHEMGDWLAMWLNAEIENPIDQVDLTMLCDETIDTPNRIGAAIAVSENEDFVAAPAWSCRFTTPPNGSQPQAELFAKPDDRWEQNEISIRATAIVEKMQALRDKLVSAHSSPSNAEPVNWLDDDLVKPSR